ncbi:MAG TPA: PD-(D/E)XK motif protein, partial [Enhygromyxa sp.]|nr:PD-(D/E)XK motif protein [Enhygromyxa sp.]
MPSDELINLWTAPRSEQRTKFEILRRVGDCYAAISPSDTAALIVPLPEGDPLGRGRVLGSVRLSYEDVLQFEVDEKSWAQPAAVIDCLEARLVRTFCAVVRDVVERLQSTSVSAKQVAAALSAWDDLLRRKSKLTEASELGLWGELLLISLASNRDAMIAVWRGPFDETIDFLGGGVALECKTSPQRLKHHVTHRQASFEGEHV